MGTMRRVRFIFFFAAFVLACSLFALAQQIPAGTVLPIELNSTLDARHDQPGKLITGRVMQDVPLPDGARIPKGAKVLGQVISRQPLAGAQSQLAIKFDAVEFGGKRLPLAAHLRALASTEDIFQSHLPTNAWDDYGTSPSDWNTLQIGGAEVYRGSGELISGGQVVGKARDDGSVMARLTAAPDRGCTGSSEREQALWKFSPWSCGTYGFRDLRIVRSENPGEIVLQSSGNVHVDGGSGWLLRAE
jgi:hypothetical protein